MSDEKVKKAQTKPRAREEFEVLVVPGTVPAPTFARKMRYQWDSLTAPGKAFVIVGATKVRPLAVPKRLGYNVTQEVKSEEWVDDEGNEMPPGVVVRRK